MTGETEFASRTGTGLGTPSSTLLSCILIVNIIVIAIVIAIIINIIVIIVVIIVILIVNAFIMTITVENRPSETSMLLLSCQLVLCSGLFSSIYVM